MSSQTRTPSTGRLLATALGLMRRSGSVSWIGIVLLGVVVSATEVVAAVLIFGLVRSAAEQLPLSEAFPGPVMDAFPGLADLENLRLTLVIGSFFVVRALLSGVQAFFGNRAVFCTAVSVSEDLMAGYMEQDYEFHVRRGSAQLIRNVRESVDVVAHHVLVPLIRAGSEAVVSLGLIVALLLIAPLATLIVLGVLALVGVITFLIMRGALAPLGHQSHEASVESLKASQELFRGIRDVKLLESDASVREPFSRAQQKWGKANYWRSTVIAAPRLVAETTLAIAVLVVLLSSGGLGPNGANAIALVGLFAYAAVRLIPAVAYLLSSLNGLSFGAPALLTIATDLGRVRHVHRQSGVLTRNDIAETRQVERIEFVDVWYRYSGAAEPAVRAFNLAIDRGSTVGIIGASGSGKSTLVDLLAGLLTPTSGRVLVDGASLQSLPDWPHTLGVVSQMPYIADDSVMHNIAFGIPDDEIDANRVRYLADIMNVIAFATPERGGLNMLVGESGVELSGGERQRIALARSLYRYPDVLILDEATSALDTATEATILKCVMSEMRNKTVVVVGHRASAIRKTDTLVMMVKGAIATMGTYMEVVASSSFSQLMLSAEEDTSGPRSAFADAPEHSEP